MTRWLSRERRLLHMANNLSLIPGAVIGWEERTDRKTLSSDPPHMHAESHVLQDMVYLGSQFQRFPFTVGLGLLG